jgi:hypothetical protein
MSRMCARSRARALRALQGRATPDCWLARAVERWCQRVQRLLRSLQMRQSQAHTPLPSEGKSIQETLTVREAGLQGGTW